ncbi:hypothetical protein BYT27DRAFT_6866407 [Phlegmacium glaucopus]|nr:hypothetical protein BYT27DRAFT_6866407 [Phlegmacium glaucopus]
MHLHCAYFGILDSNLRRNIRFFVCLSEILDSNRQPLSCSRYPQLQALTSPCIIAVMSPSRR